jgi:hypothetical protein
MPEISGVKGGLGTAAGGLGIGSGIGFTMPEIELFGIKSQGEKVCILLDSRNDIMVDEIGGIRAYTIIKQELVRILNELPPTTLFNVIVFGGDTVMRFPNMVPATEENLAQVQEWLEPLNAVDSENAGRTSYGTGTLGSGGTRSNEDLKAGKFQGQPEWYRPVMLAMKMQADSIFLLTSGWGIQRYFTEEIDRGEWYESSAGRRWREADEESKRLWEKENKERAARGEPPQVFRSRTSRIRHYFPNIERPPKPPDYDYTAKDYIEAMQEIRKKYGSADVDMESGVRRRGRGGDSFSFNVVHFRKKGEKESDGRLLQLTRLAGGDYEIVAGLEAIESFVTAPPDLLE